MSDSTIVIVNEEVSYVLNRLKSGKVITKSDLEYSTLSFIELLKDNGVEDIIGLKKKVTKVYENSTKGVLKYTKLLKDGYTNFVDNGVVFYVNDGKVLKEVSSLYDYINSPTTLGDLDTKEIYGLPIDNYMLLYKLCDEVMGFTHFKVGNLHYIHCFTVSLVDDCVLTLFLIGDELNANSLGIKSALCDKVVLCNTSRSIHCKKIVRGTEECIHKKYLNVCDIIGKRVLSECGVTDGDGLVCSAIMDSIVLRENAKLCSGIKFELPTIVVGGNEEVLVYMGSSDYKCVKRSI